MFILVAALRYTSKRQRIKPFAYYSTGIGFAYRPRNTGRTCILASSKKAKMWLKHAINCVRCMERMRLQHVHVKAGLRKFDREICVLIIPHALVDQPKLIRKTLRCYWTQINNKIHC